jgi:hypothetical protein
MAAHFFYLRFSLNQIIFGSSSRRLVASSSRHLRPYADAPLRAPGEAAQPLAPFDPDHTTNVMDVVDCNIFEEYQKARYSSVSRIGRQIITENNHDERIKKMVKFIRFYLGEKIEEMNNLIGKYKKYKGKNVKADILANIQDEINKLKKARELIEVDIK